MTITLLSKFCKQGEHAHVCLPKLMLAGFTFMALLAGVSMWTGFQLGSKSGTERALAEARDNMNSVLDDQYQDIVNAREETRYQLDALALKIGTIQAHVLRLDALGERLVQAGKLDSKEFDFDVEPAQGGVGGDNAGQSQSAQDIATQVAELARLLEDREQKLLMLEDLLLNREFFNAVTPSGLPVEKGWLSSGYGSRTDPFTGKKKFHHGIDYAGKEGGKVVAVAAGMVVRSDKASGYGNTVEILHPDGLTTRYAHNKTNLVEVGDMVDKGQEIALLGSTGRSTGPHVHFEVRKDGKVVNPKKFVSSH